MHHSNLSLCHQPSMRSLALRCAGALLFVSICSTAAAAGAATQAVSPAEVLLFETDHLARLPVPSSLVYSYVRSGNVEPDFRDAVQLDVVSEGSASKVALHFLSGERKYDLPAITDAHGNPVLLGFLEHDIADMKRRTGGSVNYFRKRIRMALADASQVTRETISYDGRSIDVQVVRIQPYLNDPMHARFEQYLGKTYTFVLSEQVPGQVYRVHTSLAAPAGVQRAGGAVPAAPVMEETLTLVKLAQP